MCISFHFSSSLSHDFTRANSLLPHPLPPLTGASGRKMTVFFYSKEINLILLRQLQPPIYFGPTKDNRLCREAQSISRFLCQPALMQSKWYKHLNCMLVRFSYCLHSFCRVQARVSVSRCCCVKFSHACLTTTCVSPSPKRQRVIQLSTALQKAGFTRPK